MCSMFMHAATLSMKQIHKYTNTNTNAQIQIHKYGVEMRRSARVHARSHINNDTSHTMGDPTLYISPPDQHSMTVGGEFINLRL